MTLDHAIQVRILASQPVFKKAIGSDSGGFFLFTEAVVARANMLKGCRNMEFAALPRPVREYEVEKPPFLREFLLLEQVEAPAG